MREIEAQAIWRDQRAFLGDVIAENLAKRLVEEMCRGMIFPDRAAARVVNFERERGSGL